MQFRKILVPFLAILFVVGFSQVVSAQKDWVKIGEKDVDFNVDHDSINASNAGKIREIHIRVMNAPVKFTRVVLNYKDGEKKELEFMENVEIGQESRSITIEGDGHVIKSIDLWYETASLGGKKAKVSVFGRP